MNSLGATINMRDLQEGQETRWMAQMRSVHKWLLALSVLGVAAVGCHRSTELPIILTHLRVGWIQPKEQPALDVLSNDFLRETGFGLRNFNGVPENTLDQLALTRKLLQGASSGPDVLDVDVSWLGALQNDLVDLRPYFQTELSSMSPGFASSYVVGGKLVAIPYQVHVGSLAYRADLLREYGYVHSPTTWLDLEHMAARIQSGERAKGKTEFWGYVWPGAATESLTCNALEWQADEGGGRIIEDDKTISVNNPASIRAWQRAKHWTGWISPPSVAEYREADAINAFNSGKAAFVRIWVTEPADLSTSSRKSVQIYPLTAELSSGNAGYTTMPGGSMAAVSTLGGLGLSISRYSLHPREDATLIRFLLRRQFESWQSTTNSKSTQMVEYDLSPIINQHIDSGRPRSAIVIDRPSSVAGASYEQVSRAYFGAVHSVLVGNVSAPEAASLLEKQLVTITGFHTGSPSQ